MCGLIFELYVCLCAEGRFVDVVVNGAFYFACRVDCYVSGVGWVLVFINVKVDTDDVYFLCGVLVLLSVFVLVELVFGCCVFGCCVFGVVYM